MLLEKSLPFCLKMTYILSEKVRTLKNKQKKCHFSDFGSFLEGRLRPENSSDWAEILTRCVSDKSAKKVFLARMFFSGCQFSDFSNFLEGRLPSEDGSDRAENLTRSVSDKSAKNIFLAQSKNPGVTFRISPIFWKVVYPPRMTPIGLKN